MSVTRQPKERYSMVVTVPPLEELHRDDGGMFRNFPVIVASNRKDDILHDQTLSIDLCSWSGNQEHMYLKPLCGERIRVTVEVLESESLSRINK